MELRPGPPETDQISHDTQVGPIAAIGISYRPRQKHTSDAHDWGGAKDGSRSARDADRRRQGEVVATATASPCPAIYSVFLRFRPPARLCVRGLEFHPRAVAASSTRRSPPGDLAPSRRIGPERSLRPTGAPSRAGQIVPGFALDAPVGEDMAQAQVVGQIKQRRLMSQVGPHAFVPPTSDGEGVGSETAGDLPPTTGRTPP